MKEGSMTLRRGQRAATIGAMGTGFFVLVAHALLETARDALFLSNVPAARLPWMYLALAALGICVSEVAARTSRRADVRWLLLRSQTIAAVGTLVMTALLNQRSVVVFYVLYLWVGVASMSVLVRYWQHLSGTFTATDAKRLFHSSEREAWRARSWDTRWPTSWPERSA
jgi:hypothetical protein